MTSGREALLEKLLVSLHLSVPERQTLGTTPIDAEEIAVVVKRLLERNGVFPSHATSWKPGETVFEGFFLVKHQDGTVTMNWQRSNPVRPTELADRGSAKFDDVDAAITAFIQREWSNGIDGIPLLQGSSQLPTRHRITLKGGI